MTPSLPRRRLLAAAVPGLLAGCLVESSEDAGGSERVTDRDSPSEGGESPDERRDTEGQAGAGERTDTERQAGAGERTDTERRGDDDPPAEVGPDGSGLVVTNVDIRSVTSGGYETTVTARLTVENAGRFTYGTVELRADAYATQPNASERDAVGYSYVTRQFSSGDRFADGTVPFTVEIVFPNHETHAFLDADWYEVDAAVRRAEPV